MKISAKTKDYRLLVTVKLSSNENIDEKEQDRFSRAFLRCFLKVKEQKKNVIEFSGPVGISLQDRLKKEITKRDFLFILEHIVVAIQKLNGNGFPIYNLRMDPQSIFINETTKEMQFLYIPLKMGSQDSNIIELFNTVIYSSRPAQERDMEYISRFNYFFKSLKPFDINKIELLVQHEDSTVVNTVKKHNAGQSGYMTSSHQRYYDHLEKQEQERMAEETALLYDENATELLREDVPVPLYDKGAGMPAGQPAGVDTDATGLLTEPEHIPFSAPVNNIVYTPPVEMAPPVMPVSGEEATGLLTEPEHIPFSAPVNNVVYTPPVEMAPPVMPAAEEEATGLLTEPEHIPFSAPVNDVVNTPPVEMAPPVMPVSGEEATGLLTEPEHIPFSAPVNDVVYTPPVEMAPPVIPVPETEETVLLNETPVAAKEPTIFPELYRVRTGDVVRINKPVFRLGKERSYVDYFVTNNNAVSRSHADIITRPSGYFVVDLNSKNRTFINNVPLVVQQETRINEGDVLRLGNEEFVFRFGMADGPSVCPNCKAPVKQGSKFCTHCGTKI